MNYVFVNFEMSAIGKDYKELRQICRQEIIEIGAIMLDESFSEISSFEYYGSTEPPVRFCLSHYSGDSEPVIYAAKGS